MHVGLIVVEVGMIIHERFFDGILLVAQTIMQRMTTRVKVKDLLNNKKQIKIYSRLCESVENAKAI
jgi:hypothetical protein